MGYNGFSEQTLHLLVMYSRYSHLLCPTTPSPHRRYSPSLRASVHELGHAGSFKRSERKSSDAGLGSMEELNFTDAHDDVYTSQTMISEQNSNDFSFDLLKEEQGASSSYSHAAQTRGPLSLLSNESGGGDDRFSRRFVHGTLTPLYLAYVLFTSLT